MLAFIAGRIDALAYPRCFLLEEVGILIRAVVPRNDWNTGR